MSGPLAETRGGVRLSVHAQPGAKRDEISGLHGDRLRVRVSAPAEDGKANARLVEVVAAAFRLRRAQVEIVSGESSRRKELLLAGTTLQAAQALLEKVLKGGDAAADS